MPPTQFPPDANRSILLIHGGAGRDVARTRRRRPVRHRRISHVPILLRQHKPLRLIVRDPDRLPAEIRGQAEIIVGSHHDRDVLDHALDGADALFWLMPSDPTASSAGPSQLHGQHPATGSLDQGTGQDTIDVLGTPIRYQSGDRAAVKAFLLSRGFSEAMARSAIDMDLASERGINNATPRTAQNTTPTTFREFAEDAVKPAVTVAHT